MKVHFTLSIGIANAKQQDTVDIPDDYTDDQINEEYQDWLSNYLDGGWHKVEDGEDQE